MRRFKPSAFLLSAALLVGSTPPEAVLYAGQMSSKAPPAGAVPIPAVGAALGSPEAALPLEGPPAPAPGALPPGTTLDAPAAASVPQAEAAGLTVPGAVPASAVVPYAGADPAQVLSRSDILIPVESILAASQSPAANDAAPVRQLTDAAQAGALQTEAPAAPASAEQASAAGTAQFDGQKPTAESGAEPVPNFRGPAARVALALHRFGLGVGGRLLPRKLADRLGLPQPVKRVKSPSDKDPFGGPPPIKLGLLGRLGYGLKWGLSLMGVQTLFQVAVKPLLAAVPWQNFLPNSVLHELGRVELLTSFGPGTSKALLSSHPWSYLLVGVPLSSVLEELAFRFLTFGKWFLGLAILGAASRWAAAKLAASPDFYGSQFGQRVFGVLGKASRWAFPVAAAISALSFAAAHFEAWGFNPYYFALQTTLGLGLAYVVYRTRSLLSAAAAHFSFNLLSLSATLMVVRLAAPQLAWVYNLLLGVVSVGWLYFHWRSHRKAKALAAGEASIPKGPSTAGAVTLAVALLVAPWNHGLPELAMQTLRAERATAAPPESRAPDLPPSGTSATGGLAAPAGADALPTIAQVTAAAKPAVVMVRVTNALGSGFIISPGGLVVTNGHVVASEGLGAMVRIQFSDGSMMPAKVVALNRYRDLAVLQLPESSDGWPYLPIGDSAKMAEGDEVLALGRPLGLPFSLTVGHISGVGNRGNGYSQYLQTDAAINHGNSGGPLLNRKGEVIGINTALENPDGEGSIGLNFAITSADLSRALAQYKATKNIDSAWLGIIVDKGNPLPPDGGVAVERVRPGSPAAQAGLTAGDVILSVDGKDLPSDSDAALAALSKILSAASPEASATLSVARGDAVLELEVSLGHKQ